MALLSIGYAAKADIMLDVALDRCQRRADAVDSVNSVLKNKVTVQAETISSLQYKISKSGEYYNSWLYARDILYFTIWGIAIFMLYKSNNRNK